MELKLRNIICNLGGSSHFSMESDLSDLGIDSLKMMELLIIIEDSFQIEIAETLLTPENFKTPQTVLNLIQKVLA